MSAAGGTVRFSSDSRKLFTDNEEDALITVVGLADGSGKLSRLRLSRIAERTRE